MRRQVRLQQALPRILTATTDVGVPRLGRTTDTRIFCLLLYFTPRTWNERVK